MQTLFLDFGSHHKTIAFIRDEKTVTLATLETRPEEGILLPRIRAVVEEGGGTMETLNRIAAVSGPGGFMSLRTGIGIANALSWSLGIPVGGVLLPDLYEARLPPHPPPSSNGRMGEQDVLWLHSTKKDLLFAKSLGKNPTRFLEVTPVALNELDGEHLFVGELIPEHQKGLSVTPAPELLDLNTVLPSVINNVTYEKTPLLPWYGRGI